jgi:hypothetical protein
VKLVVGGGVRVLGGDMGSELDVFHDGVSEAIVGGHVGIVERRPVKIHEALSLFLGDAEMSVNVDQILETDFLAEVVGSTEGFCGECREVVDVLGLACTKEGLKQRVSQDTHVEGVLETVDRLNPTCVFEHRHVIVHGYILPVRLIRRPIRVNRNARCGVPLNSQNNSTGCQV